MTGGSVHDQPKSHLPSAEFVLSVNKTEIVKLNMKFILSIHILNIIRHILGSAQSDYLLQAIRVNQKMRTSFGKIKKQKVSTVCLVIREAQILDNF